MEPIDVVYKIIDFSLFSFIIHKVIILAQTSSLNFITWIHQYILVAMQYFLLLIYFSIFSIISSISIFKERNDEFGQSTNSVEDPSLSQSDSLIPSSSLTNMNNDENRFDSIPADDKEQNTPVLDSSILMAENSPKKDTEHRDCYREKDLIKRAVCLFRTYNALA